MKKALTNLQQILAPASPGSDPRTLAARVRAFVENSGIYFEKRVAEKFNAKVMTLWPYGPQVFYCNAEIASLDDFEGLKIRSYTASMSTLIEALGASPVTMSFKEVYPALQRGVVDCAITSPTSGNTGIALNDLNLRL